MKIILLFIALFECLVSASAISFTVNRSNYTSTGANFVGIINRVAHTESSVIPSFASHTGSSYNVVFIASPVSQKRTRITISSPIIPTTTAFANCSNLANIYSHISSPMSLVNYQFYGVNTSTCKFNVAFGAKPLYQTTLGWKDFLNIIEMVATSIDQAKATQLTVVPTIAVSTVAIQTEGNNYPQLLRIFNAQRQLLYEVDKVFSF